MNNAEFLKEFINTIGFLLPVLGLVWKGAKLTSRVEQVEREVKEKSDKFCKDHKEMQERIEEQRKSTDRSIDVIMDTLTEIKTSIARVETKLEIREQGK